METLLIYSNFFFSTSTIAGVGGATDKGLNTKQSRKFNEHQLKSHRKHNEINTKTQTKHRENYI